MVGLNLFSLLARGISQYFQSRSGDTQLRRELLAHRRRELLHQHIPDVYAAQEKFGVGFDELHQLLISHDPAGQGKLAATSPYYPELARTLLYQLPLADSEEKLLSLVKQEISLWFGQAALPAQGLAMLTQAISQWRSSAGKHL
jgi:hypothetical protein